MNMKCIKALIAATAAAAACAALADTEKVGGYTWSYYLKDGKAVIVSPLDGAAAVAPAPKGTVVIPSKLGGKSVRTIGGDAFTGCDEITDVVMPSTVQIIQAKAFYNCSSLRSVKFPSALAHVGESCFEGCTALECADFGTHKGADFKIRERAFYDCSSLKAVVFKGKTPPVVYEDSFAGKRAADRAVYVPTSKWPSYEGKWAGLPVKVGDCTVTVNVKAGTDEAMSKLGTVQGGGQYAVGKKATLKAKPAKDCVFCGWCDMKNDEIVSYAASYSYTVTGSSTDFRALFATVEDDQSELAVAQGNIKADDNGYVYAKVKVVSLSEPKITFKGLPSGVKFNAAKRVLEGTSSKPGVYEVKISVTNKSVKKAITDTFRIVVPNKTAPVLPNLLSGVNSYGTVRCGVNFSESRIDCTLAEEGWKLKASGLPSGLKFKDGKISGVPTKAGSYTVTFTATKKGETTQIATITLNITELDEWAVGTFTGGNSESGVQMPGQWTITVTAKGKVSGRYYGEYKGKETAWTFSAPNLWSYAGKQYSVSLAAKRGGKTDDGKIQVTITPGNNAEGGDGYIIDGKPYGVVKTEPNWRAYQQVDWKSAPWKSVSSSISKAKPRLPCERVAYEGGLLKYRIDAILKFGASGAVTTTYQVESGGFTTSVISTGATLIPVSAPDAATGAFSGIVNLYIPMNAAVDFNGYYEKLKVRWDGSAFSLE